MLELDSLDSRRRRHVAKIVNNIVLGNTHPYFSNFFSPSSSTTTDTALCSSKAIDRKRFSRFGLRIADEVSKLECTSIRALEPTSEGRSLAEHVSLSYSQATASVNFSNDLFTADVAPVGHRG